VDGVSTWPDATLDPIRRLHVVAAALPNAGIGEIVVDRPYDEVWPWLMDLERSVPTFDAVVESIRIRGVGRDGRLRITARQRGNPLPMPFLVTVEDGWCLMQARARAFVVLMAAVPLDDGRTRYAHAEAVPIPGTGFLRARLQRMVDADLRGVRRALG
jgi:hypothetical protein